MTGHGGIEPGTCLDPEFQQYTPLLLQLFTRRSDDLRRPGLSEAEHYEWLMLQELLGRTIGQPATVGETAEEIRQLFLRTFEEWMEWAEAQSVASDALEADLTTAWKMIWRTVRYCNTL